MKLYLVSNGKTILDNKGLLSGQNSAVLSSVGMLEVFKLKHRLKEIKFSEVFVSPQPSAIETVKILKSSKIKYTISDDLKNIDFASFEGDKIIDIINDLNHPIHDLFARPQSFELDCGEDFKKVQKRCLDFYEKNILEKHDQDKNIMVVTHTLWIKNFICALFNLNENYIWLFQKLDGCNAYLFEFEGETLVLKGLQI